MAEVRTRECDVPGCNTYGPEVLTVQVRAGRLKSSLDLCRQHRRPVVDLVQEAGASWSGRTSADEMALAGGELTTDL